MTYYTIEQAKTAECTLEPIKCCHCGHIGETTYNQAVGDYYCAVCGKWQSITSVIVGNRVADGRLDTITNTQPTTL